MSLQAIARDLETLTADLRHLESRVAGDGTARGSWSQTLVSAQVDALHVRLDTLADEVHGYQALAVRIAAGQQVAGQQVAG